MLPVLQMLLAPKALQAKPLPQIKPQLVPRNLKLTLPLFQLLSAYYLLYAGDHLQLHMYVQDTEILLYEFLMLLYFFYIGPTTI